MNSSTILDLGTRGEIAHGLERRWVGPAAGLDAMRQKEENK
jgi:hypothetical protein